MNQGNSFDVPSKGTLVAFLMSQQKKGAVVVLHSQNDINHVIMVSVWRLDSWSER